MGPGVRAVDDQPLRIIENGLVPIAGEVPHHHLVAFSDLLAAELPILQSRSPHVNDRSLPTDYLSDHVWNQARIVPQLLILIGIAVQRDHAPADAVPGGVVSAHDQQQNVAEKLLRVLVHLRGLLVVDEHGDQVELRRLLGPLGP